MPISALPTPPSTASPSNFDARADAFLGALPTFVTEANALAVTVDADKVASAASATNASTSATNAAASATSAATSASSAAATAGVTKWISGTSYTQGDNVWSPATFLTYRRKVTGGGTTDPSADATNWATVIPPSSDVVLLATLTPTASANVDFLTTFTSDYDNYLIIGNNVNTSSDNLVMRIAVGGVTDTSNIYRSGDVNTTPATDEGFYKINTSTSLGGDHSFTITLLDVNSSSTKKFIRSECGVNGGGTDRTRRGYATTSSVLSGVRFLWESGSSFSAQGKIRIYGFKNS